MAAFSCVALMSGVASTTVNADAPLPALDRAKQVDVKDFGAKGDGVADDYDAIHWATAAANGTGHTLFFPKDNYRIGRAAG